MKTTEYALSVAVADYLRAVLPPEVLWSTIGHGGGGKVRGAKLKRAGLRPGIADLMICWTGRDLVKHPRLGICILWIELKSKTGRLSDAQADFFASVVKLGHEYGTARSVAGVEALLRHYMVPTRGRIAA